MVDKVEHWEGTEFELREGRVAVRRILDPRWLVRLSVERFAFPRELAQLSEVPFLLALILRPAPEAETRPLVRQ